MGRNEEEAFTMGGDTFGWDTFPNKTYQKSQSGFARGRNALVIRTGKLNSSLFD